MGQPPGTHKKTVAQGAIPCATVCFMDKKEIVYFLALLFCRTGFGFNPAGRME